MPDILGYWDRWADTPYYPKAYDDLTALEKWVVTNFDRMPNRNDRKKYEDCKKQTEKGREKRKELETIIYVSWEESERGWGTRPDGCSLHITGEDYNQFLKTYWKGMPEETPDEYSRPAGDPTEALASPSLYKQIKNAKEKYGLRIFEHEQVKLEKNKDLTFKTKRNGWMPIK